MESKNEINDISRFRIALERIVYKLEKILETKEPIINGNLWRQRIDAVARIRGVNCNIKDIYPKNLWKMKKEILPDNINDEGYLEIIKSIASKSKRGFLSKYNVFLDELEELIKNSKSYMRPLSASSGWYEPYTESRTFSFNRQEKSGLTLDEMKKAYETVKNFNNQLVKREDGAQKRLDELKRESTALQNQIEKKQILLQQYKNGGSASKDFQEEQENAGRRIKEECARYEGELRSNINKLKRRNKALEDELLFLKIQLAEHIDKQNISNQRLSDDHEMNAYTNQKFL